MNKSAILHCSFCGKPHTEVRKLIAGSAALFICDECVQLCVVVIGDDPTPAAPKHDRKARLQALTLAVQVCTPGNWKSVNGRFQSVMEIAGRFADYIATDPEPGNVH